MAFKPINLLPDADQLKQNIDDTDYWMRMKVKNFKILILRHFFRNRLSLKNTTLFPVLHLFLNYHIIWLRQPRIRLGISSISINKQLILGSRF